MKTLIFILISSLTLTLSAQGVMVSEWLISVTDDIADTQLFNELDITDGYVSINAQAGDRLALWDNSGVILFDFTFKKDQEYKLDLGYYLSGIYHLGVKRSGAEGKFKSIQIFGQSDAAVAVLAD